MGSSRTRGIGLAILGLIAMGFGQPWLSFALMMAAAAELSLRIPEADPDVGRKLQVNTRTTQASIKLVYGIHKIGSNEVFIESGGNENKWLYIVDSLGEGECDSIYQDPDTSEDQIWLDEKLLTGRNPDSNRLYYPSSLYSYTFHSGSADQAVDSELHTIISKWTDPMHYTCYVVWRLKYDEEYFVRPPSRTYILKGLKVYDFRSETTAWSNNPVLCLYDYITNSRYGKGINASKIDIDSWTEAANYCDQAQDPPWILNYAVGSDVPAQTIVDTILTSFRGQLVHFNNKIYLRYADLNYEVPVFHIKDEHIALEETSGKAMVEMYEASRLDLPDGFRVKYIDPDKDYSTDDIHIGDAVGNIQEFSAVGIGGRTETGGNNKKQALDIGVYFLERSRLNRGVRGTFRDDLLQVDPHDIVTITSASLGISGEYFRTRGSTIRPDGLIDMDFIYDDISLYNDEYDLNEDEIYSSSLPDPSEPPPEVDNPTVTEETYYYRLRTFTRLHISFNAPLNYPWYDYCRVYVKRTGDSDYRYLYDVNTDFTIDPVEEGQLYLIKLQPVSIWGVKLSLDSISPLQHRVTGKVDAPSSLPWLAAIVGDQAINLYSIKVADPDVELYEFRLGAWSGGIFMGAFRSPNLSLKGVRPGTHIFYADTLSNNAIYGEIPRSATASVPTPKGWSAEGTAPIYYNMVRNGHFSVNTDGWTPTDCSLNISGEALELNATGGSEQYAQQSIGDMFEELTFNVQFDVKSGTAGDKTCRGGLWNVTDGGWVGYIEVTSAAVWATVSGEIGPIPNADLEDEFAFRIGKYTADAGITYFDEIKCIPQGKFFGSAHTVYSSADYLQGTHSGEVISSLVSGERFHAGGLSYELAQKWNVERDFTIDQFQFRLMRAGDASGEARVYVYDMSGELPGSVLISGEGVDVSGVGETYEWTTFRLPAGGYDVEEGDEYWLTIKGSDFVGDNDNTLVWEYDISGEYGGGRAKRAEGGGGGGGPGDPYFDWVDDGYFEFESDAYFEFYGDEGEASGWILYSSQDRSFRADNLYSIYTSHIVDAGSETTRMVWADVSFATIGGGTTWEDLFPPSSPKWYQVITGKKWYELFELTAAPTIRMKLMWDTSYSGEMAYEARMMEILSAITYGRYYKMQVEIYDPNETIRGLVSSMTINFYT